MDCGQLPQRSAEGLLEISYTLWLPKQLRVTLAQLWHTETQRLKETGILLGLRTTYLHVVAEGHTLALADWRRC